MVKTRQMEKGRLRKLELEQQLIREEQLKNWRELTKLLEMVNSKLETIKYGVKTLTAVTAKSLGANLYQQSTREFREWQWSFQVRGSQPSYTEEAVKTAVINSLHGEAREFVGLIGYSACVDESWGGWLKGSLKWPTLIV